MKNSSKLRKSSSAAKRTIKTPTRTGKLSSSTVKRVVRTVVRPRKSG